jgi:flagellar hook-associated protein 1 FlgK
MSDLFSSLTAASRALEAQRLGLETVGQNIANINSPGYSRRVIEMAPVQAYTKFSAGSGVDVVAIRAQRDVLIERRLLRETSGEQKDAALSDTLGVVEIGLGTAGASIDSDLSALFDAFATLAESPTSAVARNEVQVQAERLATSFRNASGRLEAARRDADTQIGGVVDEINSLVNRIGALNGAIATSRAESALTPQDEQALLVRQLAGLVDLTALPRSDGGVDISVGNGRPLVVGVSVYEIDAATTSPAGYRGLSTGGFSITSEVTGGKLGGLLEARDVTIPGYVSQLDDLAYEVAQQINTLHATGFDQSGTAGGAFFTFATPLTGHAGAAAALTLDSAIASDGGKIAAAGIPEAGDNQIARALAALRDARVLAGGTLSDGWGQLVYRVGRDVRTAQAEQTSRGEIVNQIEGLRDAVSGISLDEEAAQMLRFQRAYEANARFFRAVDQTLELLMQL